MHANRSLSERSGYSNEELLKMNIIDLHPPERYEDMRKVAMQIKIGNNPVNDIPVLAKDGTLIPMIGFGARGTWAGTDVVIGVGRDMTESWRTQLALHESESRFRAIFESAAIGLVLGNMQGEIILAANGAFAKMLGYSPEGLIGKSFVDFTHPDDVGPQRKLLKELYAGRHDKILVEKRYIHRNGGIIWGRLNLSLIYDAEGVPLYSIGIVENITEQKQSAEAIQKEQQLLRRIIDLHERDRQITAYEIHDGMAQQVTASLFHLEAFRRLRESDAKAA